MLRALLSGISGLRSHQTKMDVIGNNLANMETIGFKASRVSFRELFAQTLRSATRSDQGGTASNPMQIGTGAGVGSIDQLFHQGSLELTGRPLDLAIQGGGLFALKNGEETVYTRAGNFLLDATGRLVASGSNLSLLGVNADGAGNIDPAGAVGEILIDLASVSSPTATSLVSLAGNLDASAEEGATHSMEISVYDGSGDAHTLGLTFTKGADASWSWHASLDGVAVDGGSDGSVSFNEDGSLAAFNYPGGTEQLVLTSDEGTSFSVTLDPGEVGESGGMTGFAAGSSAVFRSSDGHPSGELVQLSVGADGTVTGHFSNGQTRAFAQIALASFQNPEGLLRLGQNFYEASANSGEVVLGFAGGSQLVSGALEGSNVDFTQEFGSMIIAQRGFQASARVVATADEMLSEAINLRR